MFLKKSKLAWKNNIRTKLQFGLQKIKAKECIGYPTAADGLCILINLCLLVTNCVQDFYHISQPVSTIPEKTYLPCREPRNNALKKVELSKFSWDATQGASSSKFKETLKVAVRLTLLRKKTKESDIYRRVKNFWGGESLTDRHVTDNEVRENSRKH